MELFKYHNIQLHTKTGWWRDRMTTTLRDVAAWRKEIEHLDPADKDMLHSELVRLALVETPPGATISEVCRLTGLSHDVARKHLNQLVATREAICRTHSNNLHIFHSTKGLESLLSPNTYRLGDRYFSFIVVRNPFGEFVQIQERERDELGRAKVAGGLLIPLDQIQRFLDRLRLFADSQTDGDVK
jgi:hypothetical protein